ncbi:hydantoinase/oxoprolinase family protein [Ammoniphilus sp. YIM 78166]|uniref:hydantoinase/oxoprolinase family protein n=1 Tax=Ammoniphilus sp. YIM 78166 TaxID=1644106 RepID=UPI00106FACDA|nr:hydantoinase/oxoprolinase family protein [Ammoniphilus sp. YIM 78166]
MSVIAIDVGDKTVKLCVFDRREGKVTRQFRLRVTGFPCNLPIIDIPTEEIQVVVYGTGLKNAESELRLLFPHAELIEAKEGKMDNPGITLDIGAHKTSVQRRYLPIGGEDIISASPAGSFHFGVEAGEALGPACYGFGGVSPTLMDVHMLLGKLYPYDFLEYNHILELKQSYHVLLALAQEKGANPYLIAQQVLEQINCTLTREIKFILKERNKKARDTNLIALGGVGPLHAVELAKSAGLAGVIIPPYPELGLETNQYLAKLMENSEEQVQDWYRPTSLALLKRLEGLFNFGEKLEHVELSFYRRDKLFPHAIVYGPCIITQLGSTLFIPPYFQAIVGEDRSITIPIS